MSTSAIVAKSDLIKQIPSCSYQQPGLDVYSWSRIFENVASSVPLRKALEFKTLHSEAYHAVERAFRKVTKLKIDIYEPSSTSYNASNDRAPLYIVQESKTKKAEQAIDMVRFVLEKAACIKQVDLYFEDLDLTILDRMLDEIIKSKNVRLETLHVKRRHAGQSVLKIGELIRNNAATLREVSRVGISEASLGLTSEANLSRLALMSFDLGFQPAPNLIPHHMIRITESDAKIKALSYTSFAGFDPTDEIPQNLLEKCNVESIKLTMMNPPKIMPRPGYMIGKVRGVKKIELVEIVPEPQRINKLIASRHAFEKVFPQAHDNILILQQWN